MLRCSTPLMLTARKYRNRASSPSAGAFVATSASTFSSLTEGAVIALETSGSFQLRSKRKEGAVLMMRRAEIAQSGVGLAFEAQPERFCQPRFPDPGLG